MVSRFLPLILIAAMLAAALMARGTLSFDALMENEARLKSLISTAPIAFLALYTGFYALATTLSVPGAVILTLAGGLFFGTLFGGIATVLGATLGASAVFLLARSLLAERLGQRFAHKLVPIADYLKHNGFLAVLSLRLMPIFPFWLVNLAPGLFGVRLCHYVLATLIGIAPATFAFSAIGSGLSSILMEARAKKAACLGSGGTTEACAATLDPAALIRKEWLIALLMLGILALLPLLLNFWRRKPQ